MSILARLRSWIYLLSTQETCLRIAGLIVDGVAPYVTPAEDLEGFFDLPQSSESSRGPLAETTYSLSTRLALYGGRCRAMIPCLAAKRARYGALLLRAHDTSLPRTFVRQISTQWPAYVYKQTAFRPVLAGRRVVRKQDTA